MVPYNCIPGGMVSLGDGLFLAILGTLGAYLCTQGYEDLPLLMEVLSHPYNKPKEISLIYMQDGQSLWD